MKDRSERNELGINGYNPRSIDIAALHAAILKFIERKPFQHYPYDNRTGTKQKRPRLVEPCDVLVVEGIHSFDHAVASQMDLKVFFDSDESTLRRMRFNANLHKRGMKPEEAGARIQSEWEDYCAIVRPLLSSADLVVQVDEQYNYRWNLAAVDRDKNTDPTYPQMASD